jgi:hypothetical protein
MSIWMGSARRIPVGGADLARMGTRSDTQHLVMVHSPMLPPTRRYTPAERWMNPGAGPADQ